MDGADWFTNAYNQTNTTSVNSIDIKGKLFIFVFNRGTNLLLQYKMKEIFNNKTHW